jgi:hypothetical protein
MDYTLELQPNETLTGLTATVSSPSGDNPANFSISDITLVTPNLTAVFYASRGNSGQVYEVTFLATTSLNQIFEDVVEFTIQERT